MTGLVKALSPELPTVQIIWGRYFFHALLIVVLFPHKIPTILISGRRDLQVLRGTFVLGATVCAFVALRYIPIANVAAIAFVGPLLVVAMAALLLHERVGRDRWIAVAVGLIGVLIILRPGIEVLHWASFLPLGMAACYASYQILTRIVRGLASPLTSLFYTALVGALASSVVVPFFWSSPSGVQWVFMAATGLFGGVGHLFMIKAFELAPASILAPFVYSELLWAIAVGWIFFTEFPDPWMLTGAVIVVATGLYLLRPRPG